MSASVNRGDGVTLDTAECQGRRGRRWRDTVRSCPDRTKHRHSLRQQPAGEGPCRPSTSSGARSERCRTGWSRNCVWPAFPRSRRPMHVARVCRRLKQAFRPGAGVGRLEPSGRAMDRRLRGEQLHPLRGGMDAQEITNGRCRSAAEEPMVCRLTAGGRRIRTRGPSAKGKAMGSHSRQALPSRA